MLSSPDTLATAILALNPTTDSSAGASAMTTAIANYMNQVQGGPLGTVGIFTFGNSAMQAILAGMGPVNDNSWISSFANALEAGIRAGMIAPSTVTDISGAWLGSGDKDTLTVPDPSTTITTISAAKTTFISGLASATASNNPPHPLAQAVHDATLQFIFTCIGVAPAFEVPVPLPKQAE